MSTFRVLPLVLLAAASALAGCAGQSARPATAAGAASKPELLGELTQEQVLAVVPDWALDISAAVPDPEAAFGLAAVPEGAAVTVYLGTWCSDSRREVSRFWKAADLAGRPLPFAVRLIGVDRAKRRPTALVRGSELSHVPTFIVRRAGEEVGRIVESAPDGIESDLLALLRGDRRGLITGRDDLGPKAAPLTASPTDGQR
jgi:hypothetical protein